jgi:hypothetical protein
MAFKRLFPVVAVAALVGLTGSALAISVGASVDTGANIGIAAGDDADHGSLSGSGSGSDDGVGVGAGVGMGDDDMGPSDDDNAANRTIAQMYTSMDAATRVQAVIDLIATSQWEAGSLVGFDSTANATLFDVGPWLSADNTAQFESTVNENTGEIGDLHAALAANAAFSAWLQANNVDVNTVVALALAADGSFAVFTY